MIIQTDAFLFTGVPQGIHVQSLAAFDERDGDLAYTRYLGAANSDVAQPSFKPLRGLLVLSFRDFLRSGRRPLVTEDRLEFLEVRGRCILLVR